MKLDEIRLQTSFCSGLMQHLEDRIEKADLSEWGSGYTSMQNDIIQLRRELNNLRIMLDNWDLRKDAK